MNNHGFTIHVSIGRFVSLIVCFSSLLIVFLSSVGSSSSIYPMSLIPSSAPNLAYADDIMGMPSPQDAPATTDAPTAGGGPETGDGGDGGSSGGVPHESGDGIDGERSNNDDVDNSDNDSDNEPKSEDSTLTAKKIECLPGQEVTLFSTTCDLIQPTTNTQCVEPGQQAGLTPSPKPSPSVTASPPECEDDIAIVNQDNTADQDAIVNQDNTADQDAMNIGLE
jgi:hypothetical protein